MKKIMFNDKYGLTEAVLSGRKTMTRRVAVLPDGLGRGDLWNPVMGIDERGKVYFTVDCIDAKQRDLYPQYQIGEVVAVTQRYQDIPLDVLMQRRTDGKTDRWPFESLLRQSHGWTNKQGVVASLMPSTIRVTNIKLERLQDITEEDALREGIFYYEQPPLHHEMDRFAPWPPYVKPYKHDNDNLKYRCTARFAFAYLIDKVSGTGTWRSNPWTYAYEFELIK